MFLELQKKSQLYKKIIPLVDTTINPTISDKLNHFLAIFRFSKEIINIFKKYH